LRHRLFDLKRRGHDEADTTGKDFVEVAHPVDRSFEDRHVRAEAERDDGSVVADDPAADDEDPAGSDSGNPGEQEPTAAERLLEEVRARLRGEAPGDLAHRSEEGERPL